MVKKYLTTTLLLLTGIILFAFIIPSPSPKKRSTNPPVIRTLIIDPGHGGKDPGTIGLISKEKDVTLAISLKLGDALQAAFPELKIVYTRTTDILPGGGNDKNQALRERAEIANRARGDLFLCIHCNATREPAGGWYARRVIGHKKRVVMVGKGKNRRKKTLSAPVYEKYWVKNKRVGTETYIWAADRSGKKGEAINHADETGEDVEDSTREASVFEVGSLEGRIRTQLYEKRYFSNSALLASLVENEFKNNGRTSYGVKQRTVGIQVLQATGMPSILIETGFLSNKEEEEYLNSEKGQGEVVAEIVEAFRKYKQYVEGGSTPASPVLPSVSDTL